MGLAYTKEFLVDIYVDRYRHTVTQEALDNLRNLADAHYDKVGKDKFREHASITPEAIRQYKAKHQKI